MSILPIPAASLYYETLGHGPLLVMVPGATGTAESFRACAAHLAHAHTVAVSTGVAFPAAAWTDRRTTSTGSTPTNYGA
jgi:hypothetical protein